MQRIATNALQPLRTMSTALSRRVGFLAERATLQGLEVRESTLDEWLAAGGDRRANPRPIAERGGISFTIRGR